MKLYEYKDYKEYVTEQIKANKRKLGKIWVDEKTIKKIYSIQPNANNILCHGTRNAAEQTFFKKYYSNANIIGTEISDTALNFPMTIRWDFHNENKDWLGVFDIVYSNSWDHSIDPVKSLSTWAKQLNPNGQLYLEHAMDEDDNRSKASDPLEIYEDEILDILTQLDLTLNETFISTGGPLKRLCKIYVIKQ